MILIPEQISNLRNENKRLQAKIDNEYADYFASRGEVDGSDNFDALIVCDRLIDDRYNSDVRTRNENIYYLENSIYLNEIDTSKISIGTKFTVKFSSLDEVENLTLVETLVGANISDDFVSLDSALGKSILGKKVGDSFSYKLDNQNSHMGSYPITGIIEAIETDKNKYLHFIRERKYSARMCSKEKFILHELSLRMDTDEDAKREYIARQAITKSQKELLVEEAERLIKFKTLTSKNASRLTAIKRLLSLNSVVGAPSDDTIGIGSIFSVKICHGDNVEVKRVEMINRAVSDELENEYIERISSLGSKVFGLKENDHIRAKGKNNEVYSCTVFDIDNITNSKINSNINNYQKTLKKQGE